MGEAMNGPKIGETYERCGHAKEGQQHFWNRRGRWIALCPACHKLFAARTPIALVRAVRTESTQLRESTQSKPKSATLAHLLGKGPR